MNASTKTFFASIIILACSLGFAIGAFCFADRGVGATCCSKQASVCAPSHKQCGCNKHNDCNCSKHGNEDCSCGCVNHDCDKNDCSCKCCKRGGKHHGEHFKDHKRFDKKFDFKKGADFMDSVLQVTHEQKAAFEKLRVTTDSTFKELRKQKKDAERALHEALDSNDDKKIAAAKAEILKAQEALLNHRINGVKEFNKILTKEQLEKFKNFQKNHKAMPPRPEKGEHKHGPDYEHGPDHHHAH